MRISMKDIAERCGVGRSTVSFILNGTASHVGISEKLCEKVREAAKEMGYKRNELASSIRSGKSKVVAYVTEKLGTSYTMRHIAGVNDRLSISGYELKFIIVDDDDSMEQIADRIISNMIPGIILMRPNYFQELQPLLAPYHVRISESFLEERTVPLNQISSDDFTGAKMAARELFRLGHRRLGLVYVEKKGGLKHKQKGYLQQLQELNLPTGSEVCLSLSGEARWNTEDAERVQEFFRRPNRPTAVFCEADPLALRFIQYAAQAGYRTPDDISVIGYADLDYAAFSNPPLSTFATPFEEIGYKTADALLHDIETQTDGNIKIKLLPEYRERMSTRQYQTEDVK